MDKAIDYHSKKRCLVVEVEDMNRLLMSNDISIREYAKQLQGVLSCFL